MYQPGDLVEAQSKTFPSTILTGVVAENLEDGHVILLAYKREPLCAKPLHSALLTTLSQQEQTSFREWQRYAKEGKYSGIAHMSPKKRVFLLTQDNRYGRSGTICAFFPGGRIGLHCGTEQYEVAWPSDILPITTLVGPHQQEIWAVPMSYAIIVVHPTNAADVALAPTYTAALNMLRERSNCLATNHSFNPALATLDELNKRFAGTENTEAFFVDIVPLLTRQLVVLPEKKLPGAPLTQLLPGNA